VAEARGSRNEERMASFMFMEDGDEEVAVRCRIDSIG
jgi:hypothetical protein